MRSFLQGLRDYRRAGRIILEQRLWVYLLVPGLLGLLYFPVALLVGFLAVILIGFPPEAEKRWRIYDNDFLDLPARWDTGWYLGIANEGYQFDPNYGPAVQQNIAFFPAFPISIRTLSPFFGRQPLWTGVIISGRKMFDVAGAWGGAGVS